MNFVTHLECALCRTRHDHTILQNLCIKCQRPLWVKYDLAAVGKTIGKATLLDRPATLWRYIELLPVRKSFEVVSLGETMTPLLETKKLAAHFGVAHLWIKDESRLPTGSFKARGMALAISKAKEFGVNRVACPTAGNAGGAMAAYAARAGMEAYVFMPQTHRASIRRSVFSRAQKHGSLTG